MCEEVSGSLAPSPAPVRSFNFSGIRMRLCVFSRPLRLLFASVAVQSVLSVSLLFTKDSGFRRGEHRPRLTLLLPPHPPERTQPEVPERQAEAYGHGQPPRPRVPGLVFHVLAAEG